MVIMNRLHKNDQTGSMRATGCPHTSGLAAIIVGSTMNKGFEVIYESMTAKSIKKRIGSHTDTLPPLIICSQLSEYKSNHLFD